MSFFSLRTHQNRSRLGLRHRLHWGSLQRSPISPSWFQGGRFAAGGEWREGLGKGEGRGKGGMGEGKGRSWGIAPLLLGG